MTPPDRKFREERQKALDEIEKAMSAHIQHLVTWSRNFMRDQGRLSLPDHMRVQETFRWPAAIMLASADLKADRPLKEIFSRVSARYDAPDPRQVLGLSSDLTSSADGKRDGRLSAFEDVLKLLDVAERDFDITYKPLNKDSIEFWQRRHPIDAPSLETAYRENQRHFMKESLQQLRAMLEAMKDGTFKTPAPPPPSP